MPILNIQLRKIARRRRDGQIVTVSSEGLPTYNNPNILGRTFQEEILNNANFYPEITSINAVFVLKCLGTGFSNLYLPNNAKLGTIIQFVSHSESNQELRVQAKAGDFYYDGNTVPTYTAVGTGQCLSVLRTSNGWQKLNYL